MVTLNTMMEIDFIIEALSVKHGYDFYEYSRAHLTRRLKHRMELEHLDNFVQLLEKIIYDNSFLKVLLQDLSINVTEMFRDPFVYKYIKKNIYPLLKTYPSINIWHAGCASGEEVYSNVIFLEEADLLKRSQIYATDFNEDVLQKAKDGIYPIDQIQEFNDNYRNAGGELSLSEYYHAKYGSIIFEKKLKKHIVFSEHNLVTDAPFGEMNFIMCRNVLIYFNKSLQNKVIGKFYDSLCPGGILCLGTKESLRFSDYEDKFDEIDSECRIYKKRYTNGTI